MLMDLIIASNNAHKVKEIKQMLKGKFENIYSMKEEGINIDIPETGTTFKENSLIKAEKISLMTGKVVLADDSGLCVEALNDAPGVYSARYAGENATDKENNEKLLANLKNCENKKAFFVSHIILYYPNGEYKHAIGKVEGEIINEYKGNNGFGYDPLFYSYDLKKTFGQAIDEEKNSISHRGRALDNLLEML